MIAARVIFVATLLVVALAHAAAPVGEPYQISWYSIDAGGGVVTGGPYRLDAAIGQPDAGPTMTGGAFAVAGGYWEPGCLGDVDGDLVVDFTDLLAVLSSWGGCGGCPADLTGDGLVDFADLLLVLSNWGPC